MKRVTGIVIAVFLLSMPTFASAWVEGTVDSLHPLCGGMLPVTPAIEDVDYTADVACDYNCGREDNEQCNGGECLPRYLDAERHCRWGGLGKCYWVETVLFASCESISCSSDGDCPNSEVCNADGRCVECSQDWDCGSSEYCKDAGQCQVINCDGNRSPIYRLSSNGADQLYTRNFDAVMILGQTGYWHWDGQVSFYLLDQPAVGVEDKMVQLKMCRTHNASTLWLSDTDCGGYPYENLGWAVRNHYNGYACTDIQLRNMNHRDANLHFLATTDEARISLIYQGWSEDVRPNWYAWSSDSYASDDWSEMECSTTDCGGSRGTCCPGQGCVNGTCYYM